MGVGALLLVVPSIAIAHDPCQDRPARWIGDPVDAALVTSPNTRVEAWASR